MKKLHFSRSNDLSKLHDELLAAIPTLQKLTSGSAPSDWIQNLPDSMVVEGWNEDIWLTVADDADEAAIQVVVEAHTP
jgi:hypothetical protein